MIPVRDLPAGWFGIEHGRKLINSSLIESITQAEGEFAGYFKMASGEKVFFPQGMHSGDATRRVQLSSDKARAGQAKAYAMHLAPDHRVMWLREETADPDFEVKEDDMGANDAIGGAPQELLDEMKPGGVLESLADAPTMNLEGRANMLLDDEGVEPGPIDLRVQRLISKLEDQKEGFE